MGNIGRVFEYIDNGLTEQEAYQAVGEENHLRTPLNKRIEVILESSKNGCIDIELLTHRLNDYRFHKSNIKQKDILVSILKSPNLFSYINGSVIDNRNEQFYKIKNYHSYLKNFLSPFFNQADIQYIVSFLLFYKRLNDTGPLLVDDLDISNLYEFEKEIVFDHLSNLQRKYNFNVDLVGDFINYMQNINSLDVRELFYHLKDIDTTQYSILEFGKIYEYLIDKDTEHNFTNKSMQKLMSKIFVLNDHSSILTPFGGLGGLVAELQQSNESIHCDYIDINQRTLQLGYMSLLMYRYDNVHIIQTDALSTFDQPGEYDYIITELPLARKFTQRELHSDTIHWIKYYNKIGDLKTKDSILYYITYILAKLKPNGKAIFNVPSSFLFNTYGGYKEIRKYLIQNDLIEAIINLPSGTMYHSGISTSLIILNKNKSKDFQRIKVINAQLLHQTKLRNKESIIDIDEVLEGLQQETKNSYYLNTDYLEKKEFRLDINIFGKEINELEYLLVERKARHLKEIATIHRGKTFDKNNINTHGDIPVIKIQNLHNDVVDIFLRETDEFDLIEDDKSSTIDQECILIAAVGELIKPTIFRPNEKLPKIYITSNVFAILPKHNINIDYLYYQLYSPLVSEQTKNAMAGSIRTFLTIKSLGDLIIPYVEITEQKSFVDIQRSTIIAQQKAQLEAKLKLIGYQEEIESKESDILMTLTHQLRPILLKLYFEAENLKEIIESNKIGSLIDNNIQMPSDPAAVKPIIMTLDNVADSIYLDSKKLHDSLDTVDKVMSFKLQDQDFENNDLYGFFKNYIDNQKKEFFIVLHGQSVMVDFNDKAFTELLDQLLLNAEKHAFDENNQGKIEFTINENKKKQIAIIEYYNNGKKFNVSKETYIGAFQKSKMSKGSGIGGNYIYRIIKAHFGEIYLDNTNEDGFNFRIEIPLRHIQADNHE